MTPGIYFDLPDKDYFGGTALGSTDLKTLCKEPANWWYGSAYNPDRILTHKRHFDFGKALHALVLEGEHVFHRVVAVSPFPDFKTKIAQDWRDARLEAGVAILTHAEVKVLWQMVNLIHNHPEFNSLPTPTWGKEVAVFWEDDGILFRAKFDAINAGFGLDLKSYGGHNAQGRDPFDTAMRIIANQSYDVQRAHYDTARVKLREHVAAGRYFEATDDQRQFLKQVAARDTWAWVWLFYQKMDNAKGHAPVVMPVAVEQNDASHRSGREKIKTALANYKGYMARFGTDTPWAQINSLRWADDTEFVPWMNDVAQPQFTDQQIKEIAR